MVFLIYINCMPDYKRSQKGLRGVAGFWIFLLLFSMAFSFFDMGFTGQLEESLWYQRNLKLALDQSHPLARMLNREYDLYVYQDKAISRSGRFVGYAVISEDEYQALLNELRIFREGDERNYVFDDGDAKVGFNNFLMRARLYYARHDDCEYSWYVYAQNGEQSYRCYFDVLKRADGRFLLFVKQ